MLFLYFFVVFVFCGEFEIVLATCSKECGKATWVTEDLLKMLVGMNTKRDNRVRPIFFASLKTHPYKLVGLNDVVKFDDVRVNRGKGYNPSTGHFTAPRKGLYQFSCMILADRKSIVHFALTKNDKIYTYGHVSQGPYDSATVSSIVEMEKGDNVFIKHRVKDVQTIHGYNHSTFSGYFLQE